MKSLPIARTLATVLLACSTAMAQPGISGPPVCPAAQQKASIAVANAPARPNADAALAVEKNSAAQPGVLVGAAQLENFNIARDRMADYGDCVGRQGCYWKDLDATATRAEAALKKLIAARKPGEKTAIVFDIDDTTLSSYCELVNEDYGYISSMFNAWVVTPAAGAVPIPGTLRLFQEARSAGVKVFIITGRPGSQQEATERNLRAAGFIGWERVVLRNAAELHLPTQQYKSLERKKIVAAGYRIIMNVGDQWSDLNGDPRADLSVKLPNPFYFLP